MIDAIIQIFLKTSDTQPILILDSIYFLFFIIKYTLEDRSWKRLGNNFISGTILINKFVLEIVKMVFNE